MDEKIRRFYEENREQVDEPISKMVGVGYSILGPMGAFAAVLVPLVLASWIASWGDGVAEEEETD